MRVCTKCGKPDGEVEFRSYQRGSRIQVRSSWHPLLGTMSDAKVAEVAGLTAPTIYYHRKRLGIPSYRSLNEHVEAA